MQRALPVDIKGKVHHTAAIENRVGRRVGPSAGHVGPHGTLRTHHLVEHIHARQTLGSDYPIEQPFAQQRECPVGAGGVFHCSMHLPGHGLLIQSLALTEEPLHVGHVRECASRQSATASPQGGSGRVRLSVQKPVQQPAHDGHITDHREELSILNIIGRGKVGDAHAAPSHPFGHGLLHIHGVSHTTAKLIVKTVRAQSIVTLPHRHYINALSLLKDQRPFCDSVTLRLCDFVTLRLCYHARHNIASAQRPARREA